MRNRLAALAGIAIVLALAACGDDDNAASKATETTDATDVTASAARDTEATDRETTEPEPTEPATTKPELYASFLWPFTTDEAATKCTEVGGSGSLSLQEFDAPDTTFVVPMQCGEDLTWDVVIQEAIPRQTALDVLACADELGDSTNVLDASPPQQACDTAINSLTLVDDPAAQLAIRQIKAVRLGVAAMRADHALNGKVTDPGKAQKAIDDAFKLGDMLTAYAKAAVDE